MLIIIITLYCELCLLLQGEKGISGDKGSQGRLGKKGLKVQTDTILLRCTVINGFVVDLSIVFSVSWCVLNLIFVLILNLIVFV